jgi:hypothetical protein
MEKIFCCRSQYKTIVIFVVNILFWAGLCRADIENQNRTTEHYKMLSSIEYTGQGQFKHQLETQLEVDKKPLLDNQVRYSISSKDLDFSATAGQDGFSRELSFIIDKNTKRLSAGGRELTLLEKIDNHCVQTLQKVTDENIGQTWKQTFDLSSFNFSLPDKLTFTITAMRVNTEQYGSMIAVRALSEPFVVHTVTAQGTVKNIQSRINSAYLFDSQIENIYLSMSVFEAAADINTSNEKLRLEIATYKTDEKGEAVDLTGLDENFEKFVRKVGLTSKTINVTKETSLPGWAKQEGLLVAQACNISAAAACEGSLNPVASVCIPAAQTVELQSMGLVASAEKVTPIGSMLAQSIPAMSGMKLAIAPAFLGIGLQGAGLIAGGSAGAVAVAGGFDSDGPDHASPSTP